MLLTERLCYFNPRSHERSDVKKQLINHTRIISIHAPTRGATAIAVLMDDETRISIHAPTRGATWEKLLYLFLSHFNPRSHERSDGASCYKSSAPIHISIHAPTRGATATMGTLGQFPVLFQSTLPREERRYCTYNNRLTHVYFNPRSHERSDAIAVLMDDETRISIHAPTRGATYLILSKNT